MNNETKNTKESRFHNAHPVLSGIIVTVIGGLILAGLLALIPIISTKLSTTTTKQVAIEEEQSASWGPQDRQMFTWDKPADFITFNSITDNPSLGHESNFVRIQEADSEEKFSDDVAVEIGKEYEVFVYYHNNAGKNMNLTAYDVRVKANFPTTLDQGQACEVKCTISCSNAEPAEIYDTAYMHSEVACKALYVQGSAVIHNDGTADGTVLAGDDLFSQGAIISYDKDKPGDIPGCNDYAGYVTFRIKIYEP